MQDPQCEQVDALHFFFFHVKSVLLSFSKSLPEINKYKQKYRENISVGKFSRDFTDGNIPSVYTKGITVGKKIKTKQKKMMTCHFYQRIYRRNYRR
jgi:hypothetical protein